MQKHRECPYMKGENRMNLYQEWQQKMDENQRGPAQKEFFDRYLMLETEAYRKILESEQKNLSGTVKELAENYSMDTVTFIGFLDGINTSLTSELKLDELDEESVLDITIDYDKLYYNMLKAKAEWLYTLPQWDGLMSDEKRKQIRLKLHEDSRVTVEKTGRNDPCPCGSGKKYKKCCGK